MPLGRIALAEIQAGETLITPNQLREFAFFNGITNIQRHARLTFLRQQGIEVFGGPYAGRIADLPDFQQVFRTIVEQQGRGDAALAAFARATGFEAVTANSRLVRLIALTLQSPTRFPAIPIRNLRNRLL